LSIEKEGSVRVVAPARLSLTQIDAFVQRRSGWIFRNLDALRQAKQGHSGCDFTTGSRLYYLGESYSLRVTCDDGARSGCALAQGEVVVTLDSADLSPSAMTQATRLEVLLWYKKQARREFEARLGRWADRLGVAYARTIVTKPEKRWGSCNVRGDIRLNWRLIMLPAPLIDYVAAHELCHIRHKNHAAPFWRLLGTVMPDYKERRRQLRAWERKGEQVLLPRVWT
jgi:predicted metal-dependent hydrolase